MKKVIGIIVVAGVLTGCSSTSERMAIAKEEYEIHQMRVEASERQTEREMKLMESELKSTPSWAVEPPRPDETGFYGVGIGTDSDLALAIRKSNLQAQYELAQNISSELAGEDTMNGMGDNEYRFIINNFVDKVDVTGTELVRREVVVVSDGYRVFTLNKLPYAEFNRVLQDQAATPERETLEQSYDRLMQRVEGSREVSTDS